MNEDEQQALLVDALRALSDALTAVLYAPDDEMARSVVSDAHKAVEAYVAGVGRD